MVNKYRDDLPGKARELRNEPTEAERILWSCLKQSKVNGCKFRRQQPIGSYIADFVCFDKALVVEIDGSQHQEQEDYDIRRDAWLRSEGFRVMRFWNNDVTGNLDGVVTAIMDELGE